MKKIFAFAWLRRNEIFSTNFKTWRTSSKILILNFLILSTNLWAVPKPVGIINLGALCYTNASLQCMANLTEFNEYLFQHQAFIENQNDYAKQYLAFVQEYKQAQQQSLPQTIAPHSTSKQPKLQEIEAGLPSSGVGGDPGAFLRHLLAYLTISGDEYEKETPSDINKQPFALNLLKKSKEEEKNIFSVGLPAKITNISKLEVEQSKRQDLYNKLDQLERESDLKKSSNIANEIFETIFGIKDAFGSPPEPFYNNEQRVGFIFQLRNKFPRTPPKTIIDLTGVELIKGKTKKKLRMKLKKLRDQGRTDLSLSLPKANKIFEEFFGKKDFFTSPFTSQNDLSILEEQLTNKFYLKAPDQLENQVFKVTSQWRRELSQLTFHPKQSKISNYIPLIIYQGMWLTPPSELYLNPTVKHLIPTILPPTYLILQLSSGTQHSINHQINLNVDIGKFPYQLIGVVCQEKEDHAIAYVKINNTWHYCSDTDVHPENPSSSKNPIVFFYQRETPTAGLIADPSLSPKIRAVELTQDIQKLTEDMKQQNEEKRPVLQKIKGADPTPQEIFSPQTIFGQVKDMLQILQQSLEQLSKASAQTPVQEIKNLSDNIKNHLDLLKIIIQQINLYVKQEIVKKELGLLKS